MKKNFCSVTANISPLLRVNHLPITVTILYKFSFLKLKIANQFNER